PPWLLSLLFAIQHVVIQASLLHTYHILLLQELPTEQGSQAWHQFQHQYQLMATSLFVSGISTALQTTLGSRLPLLQSATFEFLIPATLLISHQDPQNAENTNGTEVSVLCAGESCLDGRVGESWTRSVQEVCGAVVVSGIVRLVLGATGVFGMLSHHCGPMVLAPTLTIIGLSVYNKAALFSSTSWGLTMLLVFLVILLSQHLQSCCIPTWRWRKGLGLTGSDCYPALRMFSILLPVTCVWIVFLLLQHFHINTNAALLEFRTSLGNSTPRIPWVRIPNPGELGWPMFSCQSLTAGIAMAVVTSLNSLGCYVMSARVLRCPPPPWYIHNRGICVEGVGSIISGMLGSVSGIAASIPNACAHGLTQAGSRHSVQLAAGISIFLGISPKLTKFFTLIPLAVHGGILTVTYAVATATGISYFQYTDIDSGRNIFIVGFTMFMALLVPKWFTRNPEYIATGWLSLNLLVLSLLTIPVFIGGILAFLLENTVPGTLAERGLLGNMFGCNLGLADMSQGHMREVARIYGLPTPIRNLFTTSGRGVFPLRTFCPPVSDITEEKVTSSEEVVDLLVAPHTTEPEGKPRLESQ
uniref:Solute carrier family 23 member 3 n=2 Tax=Latimeria chalumnae TaxID=7897 RepID=H3B854_LATCH